MSRPKLILIADDEGAVRKILSRRLTAWGYRVAEAENGNIAVQLSQKQKPDLILLDVMMPVCDGIEASRLLKEDPRTKEIPIIFVTALMASADSFAMENPEAGKRGYSVVGKPYEPIQLHRIIREALKEPVEEAPS